MENKHQFFKRTISRGCNYKNIAKSAAVKHSLMQAYCLEGSLFQTAVACDSAALHRNSLSTNIQSVLTNTFGDSVGDCSVLNHIKSEGIHYKADNFVVIAVKTNKVKFGKIVSIILKDNLISLVLESWESVLDSDLGCFIVSQEFQGEYRVLRLNELADAMCVPSYTLNNNVVINLKYSFVE